MLRCMGKQVGRAGAIFALFAAWIAGSVIVAIDLFNSPSWQQLVYHGAGYLLGSASLGLIFYNWQRSNLQASSKPRHR